MKKIFYILFAGASSFANISCDSHDQQDLTHFINEVCAVKPSLPKPVLKDHHGLPIRNLPIQKRASPFKAVASIYSDRPLEQYPLSALKFVGTLQQAAVHWALMIVPSGEVLRVRVGDRVGLEGAKVIQMDLNQLCLEEINPKQSLKNRQICLSLNTTVGV